jgi:membrane-associated phospholipid phosphatase
MIARLQELDARASTRLRRLPHSPATDRVLAAASRLTDRGRGWYALGIAGVALDHDRRGEWLIATATVTITEMLAERIKHIAARPRPNVEDLPHLAATPSPFSFPSSHTADAVAASIAFGRVLPRAPLRIAALVQAASRPYLGVHYVSDVIAGAALGGVTGRLAGACFILTRAR